MREPELRCRFSRLVQVNALMHRQDANAKNTEGQRVDEKLFECGHKMIPCFSASLCACARAATPSSGVPGRSASSSKAWIFRSTGELKIGWGFRAGSGSSD